MKVSVSEMEQRKNLCESLGGGPYVARVNTPLHHLSRPTLQEKVDTSALLSAFCLNCPFPCCGRTVGFSPPAHPAFIFHISVQIIFLPLTRREPSADEICSRVTTNERCELCLITFSCGLCPQSTIYCQHSGGFVITSPLVGSA